MTIIMGEYFDLRELKMLVTDTVVNYYYYSLVSCQSRRNSVLKTL